MVSLYESGNKECEEFLKNGGKFVAAGGNLRILYSGRAERYLIVNETGNGGEYVQPRFSTIQDLAEQLGGGLSAWEAVEAPPGDAGGGA